MHIGVHSASDAVTRTLERIIKESGHRLAQAGDAADLVIVDRFHPSDQPEPVGAFLALTDSPAEEADLVCPLRPERLMQRLTMQSVIHNIPVGNGWSLDMLARLLQHKEGTTVSLTEKECSLLNHLTLAQPNALSRNALLEQVWGMSADANTHTLETHMYRLRAKLGGLVPVPGDILNLDGAYRLVIPPANG